MLGVEREAIGRGANRCAFGAQSPEAQSQIEAVGRASREELLDLDDQSDQQRQAAVPRSKLSVDIAVAQPLFRPPTTLASGTRTPS